MYCPNCGSPVMRHGTSWECGYCGDFGSCYSSEDSPRTVELSFLFFVDFSDVWNSLKASLAALCPRRATVMRPLLAKAMLYQVSAAIRRRGEPPDPRKALELRAFLKKTRDLRTYRLTNPAAGSKAPGLLYARQAKLSKTFCGMFWLQLLFSLTPAQYYGHVPEALDELFYSLACAYAYFSEKDGEDLQRRRNMLADTFFLYWKTQIVRYPDRARARRLLARGEFPDQEDLCRDLLVTEFPEEIAGYSLEELADQGWEDILDDVMFRDLPKGILMWRTLLEAAAPCLKDNPRAASMLLRDLDALDGLTSDTADAFFLELQDDSFAKLLFQSACVENLQRHLLEICKRFGQTELGQHCLELALENPCLTSPWENRLRLALSPEAGRPAPRRPADACPPGAGIPSGDGTAFRYCAVQLPGLAKSYAYLAGELSPKAGDWVEVPFGKGNQPRRGQVLSVTDCTRQTAPWPPEQTKTLLRITEAPEPPEEGPV